FYDRLAEARIEELKRAQLAVATPPPAPPSPPPAAHAEPAVAITPTLPSPECVEAQVGNEKRCLRPKDSFKECPDCPEMVVVPAGKFTMGSPKGELGRFETEDQVLITLARPFAVGRFAVTLGEFAAFVTASGHRMDGDCKLYTDLEAVL